MVEHTDRPFTLYGLLNPQRDTQWVFVFPIEGRLTPSGGSDLKARFTSTDGQTGDVRVWSDSLLPEPNGGNTHVFWSPFQVDHGHEYRLELSPRNGPMVQVDVDVPPLVHPILGEPYTTGGVTAPVHVVGKAPRLLTTQLTVWVRAIQIFDMTGRPVYVNRTITLPYDKHIFQGTDGWTVNVDLIEAYQKGRAEVALYVHVGMLIRYGVELVLLRLDTIVASEAWTPPDGKFDPLAMVHPEVMTNVQNGFGFVGAGYRIHHSWRPEARIYEAAGFVRPYNGETSAKRDGE